MKKKFNWLSCIAIIILALTSCSSKSVSDNFLYHFDLKIPKDIKVLSCDEKTTFTGEGHVYYELELDSTQMVTFIRKNAEIRNNELPIKMCLPPITPMAITRYMDSSTFYNCYGIENECFSGRIGNYLFKKESGQVFMIVLLDYDVQKVFAYKSFGEAGNDF